VTQAVAGHNPVVVVRTDASARIGLGHLRRCVALAGRLRDAGSEIHFLTKTEDIDAASEIGPIAETCRHVDPALAGQADAIRTAEYCREVGASHLIVDHYQADEPYQRVLLDAGLRWLQFDGAAASPQWADWVVSMSPAADRGRYQKLQRRSGTQFLLGPRYAILRDEFQQRRQARNIKPMASSILLSFGGGDDRGACLLCLKALGMMESTIAVDVVLGSANPRLPAIRRWIAEHGKGTIRAHVDTDCMADLMAASDLAIISGGTTAFEAASAGLPAMIVQIAENQREISAAWDRLGVAVDLGWIDGLDPGRMAGRIAELCGSPERRQALSLTGSSEVDGHGAERITEALTDFDAASGLDAALRSGHNVFQH
jgi:UDP-2,4-diacetamido-2,4,6-trideoxy-beta-L-altropyranose hydrolase